MRGSILVRLAVVVGGAMACSSMVSAQSSRESGAPKPGGQAIHGFSIVLLLGDLQGGTTADNVPPAARKALVDMKDFLPYKGYRLLDTAWILGSTETRATIRLRGSDQQEYELRLTSDPSRAARQPTLRMSFQLADAGGDGTAAHVVTSRDRLNEQQQLVAELEARLVLFDRESVTAEKQLEGVTDPAERRDAQIRRREERLAIARQLVAARERLKTPEAGFIRIQHDVELRKVQSAEFEARRKTAGDSRQPIQGRRIIDTSFSMDVGETVVVGTSRLGGGDKAIIALLTAVARK
jgi:hypothetical protein